VKHFLNKGRALLLASHFGPTCLVVSIAFGIAISQFSLAQSLRIALAIFAGQLVIGWSNEVIDYPLDLSANRLKKPLVAGQLSLSQLQRLIPIALVSAALLSFFSPLGGIGTAVHLLGLLSATAYNLKLKRTILSPLPYIISFGLLPWGIFLAAEKNPPLWLFVALALFTTAFHFLNVLKDLQWDIDQEVLGMPQRIGKRGSISVAALFALIGVLLIYKPIFEQVIS
jgi:4-hydroxybenzoate polyprenyltransferase